MHGTAKRIHSVTTPSACSVFPRPLSGIQAPTVVVMSTAVTGALQPFTCLCEVTLLLSSHIHWQDSLPPESPCTAPFCCAVLVRVLGEQGRLLAGQCLTHNHVRPQKRGPWLKHWGKVQSYISFMCGSLLDLPLLPLWLPFLKNQGFKSVQCCNEQWDLQIREPYCQIRETVT